eukprot:TRINITY_DN32112_c0_g1_i1.p1 TRINITY_DN32112_c0_g1~~TRINITY_DN32112_c0_g1_i1.p1  ORF type:complete len:888 (-),score=219.84 TRINITY_DN32112_c0_g1_i1:138-2801(-)
MGTASPNVLPTADGKLLMSLCDHGLQYLMAGVKMNMGVKAGRYMFEVRIVEKVAMYEGRNPTRNVPFPKQLLSLGFAVAGASSVLEPQQKGQVFFDSAGYFYAPGTKKEVTKRFFKDQVLAVVLNLETNTVSLFRDGRRECDPQPLPAELQGQVLYPVISYKNMTVQPIFGPQPKHPLPFTCRMIQDAAAADVEFAEGAQASADRKPEVVFPLGIPDQGVFDWVDGFLASNPRHLELSERKFLEWAKSSGVSRPRGYNWRNSQDRPGKNFKIDMLDGHETQSILKNAAPTLGRDLVIMELNRNLVAKERKMALSRYPASDFKRIAVVAVGEPPSDFKAKMQELILADKVAAAKEAKEKEEANKKWQKGKRKWDKDEGAAAEEGEDDAKEDAAEKEDEAPIELSDEEKQQWFRKLPTPDLDPEALAKHFANYSVPAEDEGFDEIRYVWQNAESSQKLMKDWVLDRKKTQRIEDLKPSSWFKDKQMEWQKQLSAWRTTSTNAKEAERRKGRQGDKRKEDEKKEGEGDEQKEGDNGDKQEIIADDLDVFEVKDVNDIGDGRPLFLDFQYEDWTLMCLRYEIHLLLHAFKHDVDDPDRPSFLESHLDFYYNLYHKKQLALKNMNCKNIEDLVALMKDTLAINSESRFLEALLPVEEPLDKFLRLAEEHRRDRQRCMDAGDETANLKFTRPAPPTRSQGGGGFSGSSRQAGGARPPPQSSYYSGGGGGRGSDSQYHRQSGSGRQSGREDWHSSKGGAPQRGQDKGGSGGYGSGGSSRGGGSGGGYSSSRGGGDYSSNNRGGSGGKGGSSYSQQQSGQKRPYSSASSGPPQSSYSSSKQARYGSSGGGGGDRGGSSGGRNTSRDTRGSSGGYGGSGGHRSGGGGYGSGGKNYR